MRGAISAPTSEAFGCGSSIREPLTTSKDGIPEGPAPRYGVSGRNNVNRLVPASSLVLVVDVQERLAQAMPEDAMKALLRASTVLIEAASTLGAGLLATEQYPTGLGPTVSAIRTELERTKTQVLEKVAFSAAEAEGFAEAVAVRAPRSVVVVGMETHVCVFQTVRELVARGFDVHVPIDGVASRRDDHRAAGLDLCRAAGATLTTTETVVFDWLRKAGTDEFKKLSKLIR